MKDGDKKVETRNNTGIGLIGAKKQNLCINEP